MCHLPGDQRDVESCDHARSLEPASVDKGWGVALTVPGTACILYHDSDCTRFLTPLFHAHTVTEGNY